jgi:primosomal protein N' (replication factor Y)
MKYVEVLPLVTTGAKDQSFTYETDLDIQVGSVVSIPLRNRRVRGLVTKIVSKPKFPTKAINMVQSDLPVLSEHQMDLAHLIASYYLSTLSDVISAMLPFDFGKNRRPLKESGLTYKADEPHTLTPDQKKIFDSINMASPRSRHLIFGVTGSGKTEIYLQLIERTLKEGKGALILVPEISLTPQTAERFERRFKNLVAVWHSNLK